MKSLLYQDATQMNIPPGCALGERVEVPISIRKDGRIYRFMMRDKIVPEDLLMIMMKAAIFSIAQSEPYSGTPPARSVKDFLIKTDTVI